MASKLTKLNQLNSDSLTKILQEHFNDPSISLSDLEGNQNFLTENDNFNSEVKKWTFKITKVVEGKNIDESLSVVVKNSPDKYLQKKFFIITRPFTREIFWLKYAHPTLKNICPEISEISPVCYHGHSNYVDSLFGRKKFMEKMCCVPCFPLTLPNEEGLVILEDLCSRNTPFELMKKTEILTYQKAKTVFKALARFHGVWLKWHYLARKGEADSFGPLRLHHYEDISFNIHPWMLKGFLLDQMGELVGMVLKGQNVDEDIRQRWQRYTETKLKGELLQVWRFCESRDSPISTICHGDMWSNNLLFSPDSEQVVFIDYQFMSVSHPAKDLWYLLTANTDKAFRTQYLEELLKIYFDTLKPFLEDANIEMSFQEFHKEIYDRRHFSFLLGFQTLQGILSPDKIELKGINPLKKLYEIQKEKLGGTPTPEDHPLIVENRRRYVEFVEDAAECNFI